MYLPHYLLSSANLSQVMIQMIPNCSLPLYVLLLFVNRGSPSRQIGQSSESNTSKGKLNATQWWMLILSSWYIWYLTDKIFRKEAKKLCLRINKVRKYSDVTRIYKAYTLDPLYPLALPFYQIFCLKGRLDKQFTSKFKLWNKLAHL